MDELIDKVWSGATVAKGRNPDVWRKDFAGAWIRRDHYGVFSKFGWQIDHIKPKSAGGDDSIDNLQALHWRNNKSKGTNYLEIESEDGDSVFRNRPRNRTDCKPKKCAKRECR